MLLLKTSALKDQGLSYSFAKAKKLISGVYNFKFTQQLSLNKSVRHLLVFTAVFSASKFVRRGIHSLQEPENQPKWKSLGLT